MLLIQLFNIINYELLNFLFTSQLFIRLYYKYNHNSNYFPSINVFWLNSD